MAQKQSADYRISRKNLLIWTALIVFILIWMFILGILVGRGTAPAPFDPRKLEKELSELKAELLKKKQQQVDAVARGKVKGAEIEFFNNLKETGNKPKLDVYPPARSVTDGEQKNKPRIKALKRETYRSAGDSRAGDKKNKQQTTGPVPVAAKGKYAVQVASLKDPQAAAKMTAALIARGLEAYQVKVELGSKGTWYRVRVGHFADQRAARKTVARLKKMQYSAMVVRNK